MFVDILRKVSIQLDAKATMEGAGVRLHRGFGYYELPKFDPFLLFDDFSSAQPADYIAGFPWHPHRGIETVTYILHGDVAHQDSIGNSGVITAGEVQWMTAGSGIIHQEMPQGIHGIQGFQLWVNLPKDQKMSRPRYQEYASKEIPEIALSSQATARVIAGQLAEYRAAAVVGPSQTDHLVRGPVADIAAQPLYADITIQAGSELVLPVIDGHTVFIYIFEGTIGVTEDSSVLQPPIQYAKGQVVLFERNGNMLKLHSGNAGARILLVSGQPLNETIAWNGPIVMNTQEELEQAFHDIQTGNFIKSA